MDYSFNLKTDKQGMAFAMRKDLNVSYKQLGAVCAAIRYMRASAALVLLDQIIKMERPIEFRRHSKHMGARHELGGKKGSYPRKAAGEVRTTLVNAIANANNKMMDGENMIIIHACGNKTTIVRRQPSKGGISWGRGMYGQSALMHSDIEYAKIEIGLAEPTDKALTGNMKYFVKRKTNFSDIMDKKVKKPAKKVEKKAPAPEKKEAAKPEKKVIEAKATA